MGIRKIIGSKIFWAILIAASCGFGYWLYSSKDTKAVSRYSLSAVAKDTIISTLSGSGQVSGDRQLDIKPKVGGEVKKIMVKVGDKVTTGTPLMQIDKTEALKAVRDASQSVRDAAISLENAKLQYEQSLAPASKINLLQAESSLAKAQRDLDDLLAGPDRFELRQAEADIQNAKEKIKMTADGSMPQTVRDAYDQYVATLQSTDQLLKKILIDADGILAVDGGLSELGLERFSVLDDTYKYKSIETYQGTKTAFEIADPLVNALSISDEDPTDILKASDSTESALKYANDMLRYIVDGLQQTMPSSDLTQNDIDGLKSTIQSDLSSVNSKLSSIPNQKQAVEQAKDSYVSSVSSYDKAVLALEKLKNPDASAIATAREKVEEAKAQLEDLKAGPDAIDLQLAQNSVNQRASSLEQARIKLADANEALADYTMTAPFDGIIGKVSAQVSGDASAGTAAFTMITNQKIATIPLNEVDAAKVKVGQKATLTFDALEDLTISGEVAEVSPLGTVSQGVVSYDIKIAFDTQDNRVKSGMSVSASIVTDVKADVLVVPNSAVKSQGDQKYVQTLDTKSLKAGNDGLYSTEQAPGKTLVEVGTANDSLTEIISGLVEGDQVIVQTIKAGASTQTTTGNNRSMLQMGGPMMR